MILVEGEKVSEEETEIWVPGQWTPQTPAPQGNTPVRHSALDAGGGG